MSEDTKLKELIINTLSSEQMPEVLTENEIYLVEDDVEYASVDELNQGLATKQDVITDLSTIRSNASTGANLAPQVEVNTQRIEDLTTARIPDVIYRGTPKITGGQISNFSTVNYLIFPFEDISRGLPFDIYFSFTTDDDVITQQNIIDSHFGIALAIQNSKGVMALSSNGSNWDIGTSTGANTLLPNTTYYVKYSWTGTQYNASLSTNDQSYVPDMILDSNKSPYKTTIYIGGSEGLFGTGTAHPFKGIINFTKSRVVVNGITVWEGMADVGLASRANVSLNNLDELGEARFNTKQDTLVSGTNIKTINGEDVLGSGDIEIKGSSYHPPLLSFMWSDHHSLDDMSWLEADTFSWQDGNVYKTVYDKLVEEFQTNPFFTTEGSITFKITRSGYKIAEPSQENAILSKYNRDRIAWYYILDIENKRFKLPRARYRHWLDVTLNKNSTLPVMGNGMTLGLDDGTTKLGFYSINNSNNQWAGVSTVYGKPLGTKHVTDYTLGANGASYGVTTDSSKSGIVADTSSLSLSKSVEEEDFYLYFYVGEYSQTAIEQTAGLNAEMFNNKADVENVYSKSEMNELLSNKEDSDTWVYHDYDSYSGYRYNRKNGYCEQYGRKVFAKTGTALTFFKEFKDTRYNITSTTVWQQNDYYASLTVSDMTTTGFTGHQLNGAGCYWKACGYLKEGTY